MNDQAGIRWFLAALCMVPAFAEAQLCENSFCTSAICASCVAEVTMPDKEKKTLTIIRPNIGAQPDRTPSKLTQGRRSDKELEPIAEQVATDVKLMERIRSSIGSEDYDLGWAVMDEVTKFAQGLDPTINTSEGTRIVTLLLKRLGHFK